MSYISTSLHLLWRVLSCQRPNMIKQHEFRFSPRITDAACPPRVHVNAMLQQTDTTQLLWYWEWQLRLTSIALKHVWQSTFEWKSPQVPTTSRSFSSHRNLNLHMEQRDSKCKLTILLYRFNPAWRGKHRSRYRLSLDHDGPVVAIHPQHSDRSCGYGYGLANEGLDWNPRTENCSDWHPG